MDEKSICERILINRKRVGLTQEEMARQIGISVNSYREIENGSTKLVNKRIVKIGELLGISPEELLTGNSAQLESYDKRIEEIEKKHGRELSDIIGKYKLIVAELEGEIKQLRTSIETKERIIGLLKEEKEKNGKY
mgnify:CR=1 FL=1